LLAGGHAFIQNWAALHQFALLVELQRDQRGVECAALSAVNLPYDLRADMERGVLVHLTHLRDAWHASSRVSVRQCNSERLRVRPCCQTCEAGNPEDHANC